jgi:hypothetical protein
MFFFAAAQFTAFFDSIVGGPTLLGERFIGVSQTIRATAGHTFDLVENVINDVKNEALGMAKYF